MSRFDPESYLRYRVEYPSALFAPLASFVGGRADSLHLLDLGAGTGLSTRSFLKFFGGVARATLMDPDPAMLAGVESWKQEAAAEIHTCRGSGETFVMDEPVDLVLVGSAWHWMNLQATLRNIQNVLKPGGALFIFEYQFPKAQEQGTGRAINEFIRRSFNSLWKEPDQIPRGSLEELVQGVREHPQFSFRGESRIESELPLGIEEFFGLILSQSRYLAFERGIHPERIQEARAGLLHELRQVWGEAASHFFTYRFHGVRFQNRSV